MTGRLDVAEAEIKHTQEDLNNLGEKHDKLEQRYTSGHSDLMVAVAKLPTKDDLEKFMGDIKGCLETEKKRIDFLYVRDMWGTLITALLGGTGAILGIIFLISQVGNLSK